MKVVERPTPLAWREKAWRRLTAEQFDVLIIGGGITGAGIACAAARAGLSVALVEKDDIASGTSSRSSRLIHGGIRYLEHGHFGLVFESSRERRALLRLAPHLVRPLGFTWPVYRGARVARWKLWAGLTAYDLLASFRNVATYERLGPRRVHEFEPALRADGLLGGAHYYDAATNDARLTLANVHDAAARGALVLTHAMVTGVGPEGGSVTVRDMLSTETATVRAGMVVNASGPWSDAVRRLEASGDSAVITAIRGSKGAHLLVPRDRVGNRGAVVMLANDGRVTFALPSGSLTLISTTESPFDAPPDDVRATEDDVAYLLAVANTYFASARLTRADVISAWAGVRPLAARGESLDLGRASREHAIQRGPRGVLHVTGGKLTTYRVIARDVLRYVRGGAAPLAAGPLPGGGVTDIAALTAEATTATGNPALAQVLTQSYGTQWRDVWALAKDEPGLREPLGETPHIVAEAVWAVEQEWACTLADVLVRRLGIAFELRDHGLAVARQLAEVFGARYALAPAQLVDVQAYAQEVTRLLSVTSG